MRLYLFLIVAILTSCSIKKNTDSNAIRKGSDTLQINHKVFILDSITKIVYNSVKPQRSIEVKGEHIDDTARVSRDTLKLTLKLANGSNLVLLNDTTEGYSNYIEYVYLASLENIDYWLIRIIYYEGGGYMLIDKENGEKINVWGEPIFSPDKHYFLCYSWDIEAGFDPNGIQLFEIKNKKAKVKWSKEISDWGPSDVRWKNDTMVFVEQTRLDLNNSTDGYKKSYKSMSIK